MSDKKAKEETKKPDAHAAEGAEGADAGAAKAKKKKKLIIIIAAVLLLGGGGGAAVMLGGGGDDKKADKSKKAKKDDAEEEGDHGEEEAEEDGGHGEEESKDEEEHGEEGAEEEGEHGDKKKSAAKKGKPVFYDLPDIIVNLSSSTPRPHFVNLKLTLEVSGKKLVKKIENEKPRIIDSFNTYLREVRKEDLQGSAGLFRLEKELQLRLDKVLGEGAVKDILFREIIVQ